MQQPQALAARQWECLRLAESEDSTHRLAYPAVAVSEATGGKGVNKLHPSTCLYLSTFRCAERAGHSARAESQSLFL